MINWSNDSWKDVKFLLDELEFDYQTDFNGHLMIHFKNFDIVNEDTKEIVDSVDKLWLLFKFHKTGLDYDMSFFRQDVYQSRPSYTHPHVRDDGHANCTGDYVRGQSLLRDILYYSNYIKHYNKGEGWTNIPTDESINVDKVELNKHLVPEFYMDVSVGYPVLSKVTLEEDINKFIIEQSLSNPITFYWKGEAFSQYSKGSRIEHINLEKYFRYEEFFKRHHHATSIVSNVNTLQEVP
jgi:hypothetical protein